MCTDTLTDVMKMAKEKSDMPDIALIRESLFDLCESIKKTDRKKRDLVSCLIAYGLLLHS